MKLFTPTFYQQFRCIASACPDSCCKEWEVDIDEATTQRYLQLEGPLGEYIRGNLRTTPDGTSMVIQNGRCPMWRTDGLCEIQCQLGHDALCTTCRDYPRIRHDFGDFAELGLELSCPEAARLIFSSDYHMEITEQAEDYVPDYDADLMVILLRSRQEALTFLETSSLPLPQMLAVLLLYAHDVQAEIDDGNPATLTASENLADAYGYVQSADFSVVVDFFLQLEILTPQWKTMLSSPMYPAQWDKQLIALARYGIYRYWLQAVSDYDLICRVKFIIIACLLVNVLGTDAVSTAQLFSKEIENNTDNVEAILDAAYTESAFTDIHLLSLLLQ